MKTMGDFGMKGISYKTGDFVTPGTSGLGGISYKTGDYVTPGTSGLGEMGFLDQILTPSVTSTLVGSAKSTAASVVDYVWQEYKLPIIAVSTVLTVYVILGAMANAKIAFEK